MGHNFDMPLARFTIGDVVRHRIFDFRGVIFDVDPSFANSEEWYEAIPEALRPSKDCRLRTTATKVSWHISSVSSREKSPESWKTKRNATG
jgi:phosphoglycolate phosphatase-like HAD superfamily hydrolase